MIWQNFHYGGSGAGEPGCRRCEKHRTVAIWPARSGGSVLETESGPNLSLFSTVAPRFFPFHFLDFLDPGQRTCGMDARHTFAALLNSQHIRRATAQRVGRHRFFMKWQYFHYGGSGAAHPPACRAPPFLCEMEIFSLRRVRSGGARTS